MAFCCYCSFISYYLGTLRPHMREEMISKTPFDNKPRTQRVPQLAHQIAKLDNMNTNYFPQILHKRHLLFQSKLDILIKK